MFKNTIDLLSQTIKNWALLQHLTKRDISNRYKGSYGGIVWSFLNPILLLTVYTIVFSVIMKSRWGLPNEGRIDFAIVLFAGLICFNMYADTTNRATTVIRDNKNYVKKVVFPLSLLPLISLNSTFFTGIVSFIILTLTVAFTKGLHSPSVILLPLLWVPLYFMTLGMSYLISSIAVYIRDVAQVVSLFNMMFMFLSPIFFPLERMPEALQRVAALNPIAEVVTQTRNILIFDGSFSWTGYIQCLLISIVLLQMGISTFYLLKKGFADVI